MPDEERLAGILGDWYERRDRGEDVPPEEVIRAHPDLAAELRARFAALGVLQRTLEPKKAAVADRETKERAPQSAQPWRGLRHAPGHAGTLEEGREAIDFVLRSTHVARLRARGQGGRARELAQAYVAGETPDRSGLSFAYLCAAAGEGERAREILAGLELDGESLLFAACIHAVRGDAPAALACVEQAVAAGYRDPPNTVPDPDLEALLGGNPRYRELMARIATG